MKIQPRLATLALPNLGAIPVSNDRKDVLRAQILQRIGDGVRVILAGDYKAVWVEDSKAVRPVIKPPEWLGWLGCVFYVDAIERHSRDATERQLEELVSATPKAAAQKLDFYEKCGWKPMPGSTPDWQDSMPAPAPALASVPTPATIQPVSFPDNLFQQVGGLPLEKNGLPPMEDLEVLCNDESVVLPPAVIVGCLHRRDKMSLGGSSKASKSWALKNLCIAVATGGEWMGMKCLQGKVLYINFEIDRSWIRKRFKDLKNAWELNQFENITIWNLRGFAADMTLLLPKLLVGIKGAGFALIVIDPIYKTLGDRDENSNADVAALLNEVDKIAGVSGAAVVFGAHFTKALSGGKRQIDRVAGAGAWARDPDVIGTMTEHEDESNPCLAVEFTCRNVVQPKPFVVEWKWPLYVLRPDLNPADLKQAQVGGRKPTYKGNDLLKLLQRPLLTMEWFSIAEEELGCSKSSFLRAKNALKKAGKIENDGNDKWQLTAPKY